MPVRRVLLLQPVEVVDLLPEVSLSQTHRSGRRLNFFRVLWLLRQIAETELT